MIYLHEKYRPRSFDEVLGQDNAIRRIKQVLARGWGGRAWWICGGSGHGKTTVARILAKQGPPNTSVVEFNSADEVDGAEYGEIRTVSIFRPIIPTAFIINEAHGLKKHVIRGLLGILERLPDEVVVVFTTTQVGEQELFEAKIDAQPLLSRCIEIQLTSQGLAEPFAERCREIAVLENLDGNKPLKDYIKLARKCKSNFRQMLIEIEAGCMLDTPQLRYPDIRGDSGKGTSANCASGPISGTLHI